MPLPGARPSRKSQCGRILRVLADGRWHSTREILQAVPCIVHSRVSELRKTWGIEIEHETTGAGAAGSRYRLLSGDGVSTLGGMPSPESGRAALSPQVEHSFPGSPAQLTLTEAA